MLKSYRYRLYPTKSQLRILDRQLELCRYLYNDTLAYRKDAWESDHRQVSRFETQNRLPQLKIEHPEYKEVHSLTLQNVVLRVELAFKAFFRRVKSGEKPGYPRFRGKGRYDSITYTQSGFGVDSGKLHLSKIGDIKIKLHRPIEGKIKTCTIRRMPTGKWFACFSVDVGEIVPQPRSNCAAVGVDVGLESFATLSNGEKIDNPRFFRSEEKVLAKAQRRLSKCAKGTPERRTALKVVQRIHERIINRRTDFVNKVSRRFVDLYGVIVFEELDIKNMLKNHCLAKSISDAAWNMLVKATKSKAAYAGSEVVLVDPRNTSKMCSRCGVLVEKSLSDRVHECPQCGLVMDRDENAAINILRLGMQSLRKSDRSPSLYGGERPLS